MTIVMKKVEANVSYNLIVFVTSLQTLITEPCILTEKATFPLSENNHLCTIIFASYSGELP